MKLAKILGIIAKQKLIIAVAAVTMVGGLGTVTFLNSDTYAEYKLEKFNEAKASEYLELTHELDQTVFTFEAGKHAEMTFKFPDNIRYTAPEIATDKVSETVIPVTFIDSDGYEFSVEVDVKVVDTTKPNIIGKSEYTVVKGEKFTVDMTNLKAFDNIDGELKVELSENDITKVGLQTLTAKAVDKSGNEITKEIKLTVEAPAPIVKPQPQAQTQTAKAPAKTQAATPAAPKQIGKNQLCIAGICKTYTNTGIHVDTAALQKHIDAHRIATSLTNFSGTDSQTTYFSGHLYRGNTAVMNYMNANIQIGSIVTVTDGNGTQYKYRISSYAAIDSTRDYQSAVSSNGMRVMDIYTRGSGVESIAIQFCRGTTYMQFYGELVS